MKALTVMTIGAAMIGLAGLVYDTATAGQPVSCPDREASVYFERGSTKLTDLSTAVIDRIAVEARVCGAAQVIARTDSQARAKVLSEAFRSRGLGVVVVAPPPVALETEDGFIAGRVVTVGLTMNRDVG